MASKAGTRTEKSKKTQWHPAFYSAMQLEFRENRDDLEFHVEKVLNTKPLVMDLLILKVRDGCEIKNKLGAIFRSHNIIEYKSPKDALNIDVFAKVLSYAGLYKFQASGVNAIPISEMTVTFVRESVPRKLFEHLDAEGFEVEKIAAGIYYVRIKGTKGAQIQIIASGELSSEEHLWLTSLTSDLTERRAVRLTEEIEQLTEKGDSQYGDSVLQVAIAENKGIFQSMREVPTMCEALRELFQPEVDEMKAAMAAEMNAAMAAKDNELAAQKNELEQLREKCRMLEEQLANAAAYGK